MRLIARCVHGLEWLCAAELSEALPDAVVSVLDRRTVLFSVPVLSSAVLALRTADDIFAEAGQIDGVGPTKGALPAVARRLRRLPWDRVEEAIRAIRPVVDMPLIDVVASLDGRRSYNRFAVEQLAGEVVSDQLGGRYLRRTADGREPGEPDLTIRLFLHADQLLAGVRLGVSPAHRRPYKQDTGPGTLHPPAAAALALLASPEPDSLVLDPFCGDGTVMIETGLAFPAVRLQGSDVDRSRVASTLRNAARAGVALAADCADAGSLSGRRAEAIVTNPPWNLTVDALGSLSGSLLPFWQRLPSLLSSGGRLVVLANAELAVPDTLRSMGFGISLAAGVRLAGRLCHVVLAGPERSLPAIPAAAQPWRRRALRSGLLTSTGF